MARDFDGSTDRIDYGNAWDISGGAVTLSAWVWLDAPTGGTQNMLCAHQSGDAAVGMQMIKSSTQPNSLSIVRNASISNYYRIRYGTNDFDGYTWEHALVVSAAGGAEAAMEDYIDGLVPGSTTLGGGSGSLLGNAGSFSLGGRIYSDSYCFNGKIAEVGAWDRVLSAGEIAALAKGYSPLFFLRGLRFHTKLIGRKDIDIIAGKTPTYDGTSVWPHPRIIYPS